MKTLLGSLYYYMSANLGWVRALSLRKFPATLHIETTTVCNLDCEYCVLGTNMPEKKVMSLKDFESLRPYFKRARNIYLSGLAEPLMNKKIVEFIRIIKKDSASCRVAIFSNALMLTEKLSEELIDSGLERFDFSLDGADPRLVDGLRTGGDFARTVENLKRLRDMKKSRGSATPALHATTVLQRKNYMELPAIVGLAYELGAESLSINGLEPYKKELIPNMLFLPGYTPDNLPDVIEKTIGAAKGRVQLGFASMIPKKPVCYSVNTPLIMANGDVTPCAVLAYDRDYFFAVNGRNRLVKSSGTCRRKIFGNAFRTPFDEIWNSKEYTDFRRSVLKGRFPAACSSCMIKHQTVCVRADFSPEEVCQEARELLKKGSR